MNREPCKHGIVGHEDCETIEIERLKAALSAAESQLKAYAAQIYAADGFSGEHWRRVAKEMEKERDDWKNACNLGSIALDKAYEQRDSALRQRDQAANACAGDLANMRARVEAVMAERDELKQRLLASESREEAAEAEKAWLIERIEAELKQEGAELLWADGGGSTCPTGWRRNPYINWGRLRAAERERDVWQGAHVISQNTMASMVAERDRYRAALEIAAKDTSWEYVHKVAGEALSYSVPALPIDHEAEDSSLCDLCSEPNPTLTVCDSCWDEQDAENVAKARAEERENLLALIKSDDLFHCCEDGTDMFHVDGCQWPELRERLFAAIRAAKGGEG